MKNRSILWLQERERVETDYNPSNLQGKFIMNFRRIIIRLYRNLGKVAFKQVHPSHLFQDCLIST